MLLKYHFSRDFCFTVFLLTDPDYRQVLTFFNNRGLRNISSQSFPVLFAASAAQKNEMISKTAAFYRHAREILPVRKQTTATEDCECSQKSELKPHLQRPMEKLSEDSNSFDIVNIKATWKCVKC